MGGTKKRQQRNRRVREKGSQHQNAPRQVESGVSGTWKKEPRRRSKQRTQLERRLEIGPTNPK